VRSVSTTTSIGFVPAPPPLLLPDALEDAPPPA